MANQDKSNFFEKLEVVTTEFDVCSKWPFDSASFLLFVESTDDNDVIEYSFSGNVVHGEITPEFFKGVYFDNRPHDAIYLRRKFPGKAVTVRIEAWAF